MFAAYFNDGTILQQGQEEYRIDFEIREQGPSDPNVPTQLLRATKDMMDSIRGKQIGREFQDIVSGGGANTDALDPTTGSSSVP